MAKKYIESHWLIFATQGVVALLFGWFVMFTGISEVRMLIPIVGIAILCLGIIQTVNLLHREHNQHGRGITMLIAFMDIVAALSLFLTMDENVAWQLVIIALYTLARGVLEIILAFVSIDDATDRFIWLVCGICGAILGFVILNSGHFTETTTFIKFFGSYMMIFGVSSLTFGVHNHNEQKDLIRERRLAAARRRVDKKLATSNTKTRRHRIKLAARVKNKQEVVKESKKSSRPVVQISSHETKNNKFAKTSVKKK